MNKKKIIDLFEYRKLPYLLKYFKSKDRKWLSKKLVQLQADIYDLDLYLETNWVLSESKLDDKWRKINKTLSKLDIHDDEAHFLTTHIRKYQLHETQLRENKFPTRLNNEYYYYYKSCDVRLMRHILYLYSDDIPKAHALSDWRYYDLITEINDDIEDVFEDQKTINGNLYNIMIHESGLKATHKNFKNLIYDILEKSEKRFSTCKTKGQKKIKKWTRTRAEQTLKLLKKRKKQIGKKKLKEFNSGLYSHL